MLIGRHHLTYCANVHPGESWEETFLQLKVHLPKVRQAVSPDKKFGAGLYLSNKASREIQEGNNLRSFKLWLEEKGLYVFTLNGFPYGNFHGKVVKDNVYKPDWTSCERVDYTKRLFNILAELLPEGMDGGVSTAPVSYKPWFSSADEEDKAVTSACMHFEEIAFFLQDLESKTGKYLHLDIEPEPDCLLENSDEVVNFFKRLTKSANEALIKKHIALCYDICHFSVEFEQPEDVFGKLISEGIKIGKIQISSALRANLQNDRQRKMAELMSFDEPRYLHQAVKQTAAGELRRFRDLSWAIRDDSDAKELRTHFHVPLFVNNYGNLQSTQDDVLLTLKYLQKNQLTNHLEVETYTWDILPADMKMDLTGSIVRELEWVKKNLAA